MAVDKTEVKVGDTVTVTLSNKQIDVQGFGVYLEFDKNLLECTAKDADHLKSEATKCTEYDVYWYDCSACDANAKDDPNATDKFWTSTDAGDHNFTEKVADDAHFVTGSGATCQDAKEYYFDCEYCATKGTTTWTSDTYGDHSFTEEIADDAHLVAGTGANCQDVKEYYYDCAYCATIGTTSWASTEVGAHEFDTTQWGYKDKATGHAHKCKFCDEHDAVQPHTPNMADPTETENKICTACQIVLETATGHICKSHLTKVPANGATCTQNGNIEYYECSCGKYYTDSTASVEITDKASVVIKAGHNYGTLVEEVPAKHTATELKAGMKAHYFCDKCSTYFTAEKVATTESDLVIPAPVHEYNAVNGYKEADGHADTCSCGAHNAVVPHTPDREAATETDPIKCSVCGYEITPALGHVHKNNLTKVPANGATCTVDGNIEYYECSCGKYYTDSTASVEITDKASVVIKAGHNYGTLVEEVPAKHTATELKAGMKAHYFCDKCSTYFTAEKVATTESALVIPAPTHSFGDWVKTDPENHWKDCSCGLKSEEAAHSWYEATCLAPKTCSVCEATVGEVTDHTAGTEWKNDKNNHWHICTVEGCGVVIESSKAAHDYGTDNVCDTCEYKKSSSSGGGGGGSVATYAITVEDCDNGEISASKKSASKGTDITLTVKADEGYELDTLKVLDKNGDKVKVTKKGDKYTFEMPASKVTVKATFSKIDVESTFDDVAEDAYYFVPVEWAVEEGITSGTSATTFSPNASCTRAQAVTFLWRAAGSPEPESTEMPFEDVADGAYYYDAVLWAVENGITAGTSATTFAPNATCTRAQIVTFLWRSQKSPAGETVNPFADVAAGAYYYDAVLWAVENGVTAGTTATTFSPNNNCTRAQIVTFLYRALSK